MSMLSKNRAVLVSLLCMLGVTLTAVQAQAYGLGQVKNTKLASAADKAAIYLLAVELQTGGWAWEAEKYYKSDNYGGIVSDSLLASYEQTGDIRFLNSAMRYAQDLVATHRANPLKLPYKTDIEFLVRMTEVSGDEAFAATARSWFQIVKNESPRGADEVSRLLQGRKKIHNVLGYDVAQSIRAALAVEQYKYARELADAALAKRKQWLTKPKSVYGTVSRAALLHALNLLDSKRYASVIGQWSKGLQQEQGKNGSWCFNETQATAYATRGLAALGKKESHQAAKRGGQWLSDTLLKRGAWADYNDGMPEPFVGKVISEVQAEALSAVIVTAKL